MKTGKYVVSFEIDLYNCENEEEAQEAVRGMVEEMVDKSEFPEVKLSFIEGTELDYTFEEEDVKELDFEEAV